MSSAYTPEEEEFIDTYVSAMSGGCTPIEDPERTTEARRGINKIKADALREAAIGVTTQVNNAEAAEADKARDPGPYYHGARYGMRETAQWLHRRADRIEGAIK